jgi:divalent metal cation (Fe/Co/Zn/Cd) transporter
VNDIVSNFLAVIAVLLAHYIAEAWWVDPATGTLFAVYIA